MSPIVKHLTVSSVILEIRQHLYFRLNEHLNLEAPISPKAYDAPDLTISLETGRNLVYFYVADLADANDVGQKELYLADMMKNPDVLFGVITDYQKYLIYEIDTSGKLRCNGHYTLAQVCHVLNTQWIELGIDPPLEEGDYSYTKSGGRPDIIIDRQDAAYLILSKTVVPSGVAHPIILTTDMLTNFLGFSQKQNGDLTLNGFVVNVSNGLFFHNGKNLKYLSQLQQCFRREGNALVINETDLPNFII